MGWSIIAPSRSSKAETSILAAEGVTAMHTRTGLAAQRGTDTAKFPGKFSPSAGTPIASHSTMTPLRLALLGSAALAFASGCDPAIDTDPQPTPIVKYAPSGELALEVGTGDGAFEALGPDTRVAIIRGSQGGQHIWFAARCHGAGSPATITYSIEDEQGGIVSAEQQTVVPSDPQQDGWRAVTGLTAFLYIDPGTVMNKKVVFKAHLEDDYGTSLDAPGEVTVSQGGL